MGNTGFIGDCSPLDNFGFAPRNLPKKIMTTHPEKKCFLTLPKHEGTRRNDISQGKSH